MQKTQRQEGLTPELFQDKTTVARSPGNHVDVVTVLGPGLSLRSSLAGCILNSVVISDINPIRRYRGGQLLRIFNDLSALQSRSLQNNSAKEKLLYFNAHVMEYGRFGYMYIISATRPRLPPSLRSKWTLTYSSLFDMSGLFVSHFVVSFVFSSCYKDFMDS